jgi:hypothetical protein
MDNDNYSMHDNENHGVHKVPHHAKFSYAERSLFADRGNPYIFYPWNTYSHDEEIEYATHKYIG